MKRNVGFSTPPVSLEGNRIDESIAVDLSTKEDYVCGNGGGIGTRSSAILLKRLRTSIHQPPSFWRILSPIRKSRSRSPPSRVLFPPLPKNFSCGTDSDSDDDVCNERGKPSVTFDPKITYTYTMNRIDYTRKEIKACWIDDDDLARSIRNAHRSVEKFSSGIKCCIRGLEMLTEDGLAARERNKNDGFVAVLKEQEYQTSLGIEDPDEIAELYEEAGYYAKKDAREWAQRDARTTSSTKRRKKGKNMTSSKSPKK